MKNFCKALGIIIIPITFVFALIGFWQQSIALTLLYFALALQDININQHFNPKEGK